MEWMLIYFKYFVFTQWESSWWDMDPEVVDLCDYSDVVTREALQGVIGF